MAPRHHLEHIGTTSEVMAERATMLARHGMAYEPRSIFSTRSALLVARDCGADLDESAMLAIAPTIPVQKAGPNFTWTAKDIDLATECADALTREGEIRLAIEQAYSPWAEAWRSMWDPHFRRHIGLARGLSVDPLALHEAIVNGHVAKPVATAAGYSFWPKDEHHARDYLAGNVSKKARRYIPRQALAYYGPWSIINHSKENKP